MLINLSRKEKIFPFYKNRFIHNLVLFPCNSPSTSNDAFRDFQRKVYTLLKSPVTVAVHLQAAPFLISPKRTRMDLAISIEYSKQFFSHFNKNIPIKFQIMLEISVLCRIYVGIYKVLHSLALTVVQYMHIDFKTIVIRTHNAYTNTTTRLVIQIIRFKDGG